MQSATGISAREIMSKGVLTVYQDSNVEKAVNVMAEHDIGSVVVLDSLGPTGVFTERDLVGKVIGRGRKPESTVITEVSSPSFPAVDVAMGLHEVAKTMIEKRSRLMVFEGADLVGIVTPTDIVRAVARREEEFSLEGVVSKKLVSAPLEAPVDVVVKTMYERRVGSVLVGEGSPVAIFTERDLLKRVLAPKKRLDVMVGEVSTSPLLTLEYGAGGREVASAMSAKHIKRLPLELAGTIVGIVTARDVVEAFAVAKGTARPRVDWVQWN